jgi:hypothetical protein
MALLGESFKPYVRKQINVRQDKLSLDQTRDNDILRYITSKTSFLRLTSGIDISSTVAKNLGFSLFSGYEGHLLAKDYVLFSTQFNSNPTAGIGYKIGDTPSSYGFTSDNNYGLVPPPGLLSAEVKTLNRGTIREATINLVCHNVYQFKIINALFLKLKYSLLLEWGHTLYFDNGTETNPTPSLVDSKYIPNLSDDFLKGMSSDKILDEIETQRKKSSGNYDAFFGVVKNFNWELQENGSYNVTINAISQGSIIESLKVNSNLTPNVNIGGIEPQFQKSTLHKILGDITTKISEGPDGPGGTHQGFLHGYKTKDNEIALNTTNISNFTGITSNWQDPLDTDKIGGPNSIITHNEGSAITFPNLKTDKDGKPTPQYYIKLGTLLRIIESFTLYYDLSKKTENGTPPSIFYIDHNFDTNECITIPRHISTDPLTCIIPIDFDNTQTSKREVYSTFNLDTKTYVWTTDAAGKIASENTSIEPTKTDLFESPNKSIPEDSEIVVGTSVTFSNGSTGTLTEVTVNKSTIQDARNLIQQYATSLTGATITITTQTVTRTTKATINNESEAGNFTYVEKGFRTENKFIGRTMHMFVNINKIIEILDRNIDDDGNVSVYTFLTQLLSDLKYALGSINNFDVNYDATTNRFSIIDSAVIPFKYQNLSADKVAKFNINLLKNKANGGGSFVTNFGLKSEVFAKVANAIALGAQGNGNTMIANSTPLSNYNEGLTDRIMTVKGNANLNNTKTDQGFDQFGAAYRAYEDYKRKVTSTTPEEGLNVSQIDLYRSFLVDLFNYDLGTYTSNGHIPGTGFIPLNLQLTMDGLSGITQYQTFSIDETLLPDEYQKRLGFITTTVTHKIDTKGWETTINTLSIPKIKSGKKAVTTAPPSETKKPTVASQSSKGGTSNTTKYISSGQKREPQTIILHYTDGSRNAKPQAVIDYVASKGGGIHYAVSRKGEVGAGVPEDTVSIHGDNWNSYGIGIELISDGVPKKGTPANEVITLDFIYGSGNDEKSGYTEFQEYTDVQITALENLIKEIIGRWPKINNNIQGKNLWEWVFGFHSSRLSPTGRPKSGVRYTSMTAGSSKSGKDGEYNYTTKMMGGDGGYLGPRGWNVGGFNVVGGIYSHATGGGTHYDVAPTPKLVAMLVRLGYKDGY